MKPSNVLEVLEISAYVKLSPFVMKKTLFPIEKHYAKYGEWGRQQFKQCIYTCTSKNIDVTYILTICERYLSKLGDKHWFI